MRSYLQSKIPVNKAAPAQMLQSSAVEKLASAVIGLADQRQHLRDYRSRAQRSELVNQALHAYREFNRLNAEPAG